MTADPKAILFDMDGTLVDWRSGMDEKWLLACENACARVKMIDARKLYEMILQRRTWFWEDRERATRGRMDLLAASTEIATHALADMGVDDGDLARAIARDFRRQREEALTLYHGAIETLEAVLARGIATALITNGGAEPQRRTVERFALDRYFDCIVIEGEFGVGKPDERVFRHALETVICDPAAAWMVGDNLEADVGGAHALGIHTIWIDEAGAGLPADARVRPGRIIRSIAELL